MLALSKRAQGDFLVKVRGQTDIHRVHFTLQKQILRKLGDRPRLGKLRRILVGEFRRELALGARDKLRTFFAGADERRSVAVELRRFPEQIAVQAAAQAAVGADQDDGAFFDFR